MQTRKSHQKSRTGCLACKRRRKKCDEKRPCCTRCSTTSKTCVYLVTTKASPDPSRQNAQLESPPLIQHPLEPISTGPNPETCLVTPPHSSHMSTPDLATHGSRPAVASQCAISEADLYAHFLDHVCRTTASLQDRIAMQIGIGKLALDSMPVLHAVLALSAACICCDIISSKQVDMETLRSTHEFGLHHHTLALEQMRLLVANPTKSTSESMLAIAVLLPPFALSSLQIQYWMLSAKDLQHHASFTPRDAILLLRGIKTTIMSLNATKPSETAVEQEFHSPTEPEPWAKLFASQTTCPQSSTIVTGHSHAMFPVLSATWHSALAQLQRRVDSNSNQVSSQAQTEKISIANAYSILHALMSKTFTSTTEADGSPEEHVPNYTITPNSLLAQVSGWLKALAVQPSRPAPNKPLARSFISFFSAVPQDYVDLLLPLLDPDPELYSDGDNNHDRRAAEQLSSSQALALDIYAHWLVLCLLAEAETWWVGNFPTKALEELVLRYGGQMLSHTATDGRWWPLSMLEVASRLGEWK